MVKRKANREIYVNKTSTVLHYVPIHTSKWILGVEGGRKTQEIYTIDLNGFLDGEKSYQQSLSRHCCKLLEADSI